MSDVTDSDKKKGFFINASGISYIPCRCKRQSYHKETKTTKENTIVTTNVIEDRRNLKFGGGRNVSPDENGIFKTVGQVGSVEICDNGWGQNRVTSEECEQRLEGIETDIEVIKKDTERLEFELNDLKLKISKKLI